ncbi:MAG: dephospho-CoA kinase [Clostridia bacterium]|nr:dephospho-CoA kinase [Clostridia bacterium]
MAKVIGITGGIGCGKSTVARLLSEKLKAPILDADKIAKVCMKSPVILNKIRSFFGAAIFDSPEIINSERLSKIVFSSEEKLLELNKIVHPFVMEEIKQKVLQLAESHEYILLDVPLPNEEFIRLSDKIIVVTAYEEIRIQRVMLRSNLSRESVERRIAKQLPQDAYRKLADIVIENNGSKEELIEKINSLLI